MVHEELALRRNKARFLGDDAGDQFIEKVEINEPEFAKKVGGIVGKNFIKLYLIFVLSSPQARQLEIYHLKHFYDSRAFAGQNYSYDANRKVIVQTF